MLVGGEGEGDSRVLVEINNTAGLHDFDIVETFVDAKSEAKGDLTTSEYNEVLKEKEMKNSFNIRIYKIWSVRKWL